MGSCITKAAPVADAKDGVPTHADKEQSPRIKSSGGVILISERAPSHGAAEPSCDSNAATVLEPTAVSNFAAPSDVHTPRRPVERQVSGSGSLWTGDGQSKVIQAPAEPRRVSRPSTPISRSDKKPSPSNSSVFSFSPHLAAQSSQFGGASSNLSASLEAPAAGSGSGAAPRAARRRTADQLSTLIPETIQEKARGKKDDAAPSLPPVLLPGSNPGSRRGSGTFGERTVTISKIQLSQHAKAAQMVPLGSPPAGSVDLSHREGGRKFGAKEASAGARYELTDAQESELRAKPFLWTDPTVFRYHISSMFTFYSRLAAPAAFSPTASSAAATSATTAPTPPSTQSDRIDFAQLQRLARDCTYRLYLIVRKGQKAEQGLADGPELERAVWRRLDGLLPGHGIEVQTHHYVSLYFLDALAKTMSGSVGRREFALLFPTAHQRLFCHPSEVAPRDRKHLIQTIYKLKLDDLLQPRPLSVVVPSEDEAAATAGATSPPSPMYSPDVPIRFVRPGDRRRTMGSSFTVPSGPPAAQAPALPRRISMLPDGLSLSQLHVSLSQRRASFDADSVQRLIVDLAVPAQQQQAANPSRRLTAPLAAPFADEEATSRRAIFRRRTFSPTSPLALH